MSRKQFFKTNKKLAAMISIALLTVSTLVGCGGKSKNTDDSKPNTTVETSTKGDGKFISGTYSAKVTGMHEMTVTVTVSENEIVDIKVDHKETEGIGSPAVDSVSSEILELQGLGVDVVSGATLTSEAIITGVIDALKQAGLSDKEIEELKGIKKEVQQESNQEMNADVVVIGAGGAGMAAAVTAKQAGKICNCN